MFHKLLLRPYLAALGAALCLAASMFVLVRAALPTRAQGEHQGAILTAEAPFLTENNIAMTKMMDDMAVKPSGDVDRDFVAMMVPHHQGAIDMAKAVLRYGQNEKLKRLAQEIIVTQQQEIAAMHLAVGDPLPPSAPSPTQISPQHPVDAVRAMSGMRMQ